MKATVPLPLESSGAPRALAEPQDLARLAASLSAGSGTWRRRIIVAGLLAAGLLGLVVSFCHVYDVIAPDSDLADPVMLWQGMRAHGLGFLASWYYNPDNYLLSLIPFTSLAFTLFGPSPELVVGIGWAILVGCAGLAAMIAWRTTRSTWSLVVFPLLLLSSQDAVGRVGFLGYAVTHNVSMLWGLLGLLAALAWLRDLNWKKLAASASALFVGTLSDPWLGAAVALPLILASAILLASGTSEGRARLGWLLAVQLAAFLLARGQLFGLLGFLQRAQYPWASWSVATGNLLWMGRVLMLVFDPLPGPGTYVSDNPALMLLVLGPLGLYVLWLLLASIRWWRSWSTPTRLVALTCALSFCGTMSGFLLIDLPQGSWMGRFFINVYVLLPVLGCVVCFAPPARARGGHLRTASALLAMLSMLGGATADISSWTHGPHPPASKARGLARFLAHAGLHYGYGADWAAQAETVTWLSRGQVVIRPVLFDPSDGHISPQLGQSSPLWYRRSDRPPGPIFLVIGQDPLNCRAMGVCVTAAETQLGPPDRVLADQDLQILVWTGSSIKDPGLAGSKILSGR